MTLIYVVSIILFLKNPKLAFIFPFDISRISIIGDYGVPLFTYYWENTQSDIDDASFSAVISNIENLFQQSINVGYIKQINFESSIFIIKRSKIFPIFAVLLA